MSGNYKIQNLIDLDAFATYLDKTESHKASAEKYLKAGISHEKNGQIILRTGFINRLFDNIPNELCQSLLPEKYKIAIIEGYQKSTDGIISEQMKSDMMRDIIINTRQVIFNDDNKFRTDFINFLEKLDPTFMQKYSQLSQEQQQIANEAFVYSIAHAPFMTIIDDLKERLDKDNPEIKIDTQSSKSKSEQRNEYNINNKPRFDKQESIARFEATVGNMINETNQRIILKKSLLEFIDFSIRAQAGEPGFKLKDLDNKAKEINKQFNLGIITKQPTKSSGFFAKEIQAMPITDSLLAYIGNKHPDIVLETEKQWKRNDFNRSIAEPADVGVVLNKLGKNREELKEFINTTSPPSSPKPR